MKNHRLLLLGTAPNDMVIKSLEAFGALEKRAVHLLVKTSRRSAFEGFGIGIHCFDGELKWRHLGLLSVFLRLRPDEVVVVLNKGSAEDYANVIRLVDFWKVLRPSLVVSWKRGRESCDFFRRKPVSRGEMLFFLTATAGLVVSLSFHPWWGLICLVALTGCELALRTYDRALYFHELKFAARTVRVEHRGEPAMMPHPEKGWCNRPDLKTVRAFAIPGLEVEEHRFQVTHDCEGRRVTTGSDSSLGVMPLISVFGCSITYGQGVNDQETYPWRLQERFGGFRVLNYGVGGWSLYQTLLQMEETLVRDTPQVVVLGFHQELAFRGTNSFPDRVYWLDHMENPSCVFRKGVLRRFAPRGYRFLPYSDKIKLVKVLEYTVNRFVCLGRENPRMIRQTCEHLLLRIKSLCERHGAKLLVVCVHDSETYYRFFREQGFAWCIGHRSEVPSGWTLFPYDPHPSERAHHFTAKVVGDALERLLAGYHVSPEADVLAGYMDRDEKPDPSSAFIYPQY